MDIYDLAFSTWNDIGQPTSPTASYISGWMMSQANIGKLNNLIGSVYSGVEGAIQPELDIEEGAIYSEIYKQTFWQNQVQCNLGAGGIMWTEMRDGDTTFRRASPTEVAKVYKDLLRESKITLTNLVSSYKKNKAYPRVVNYENP